ncbi:MAG: hypothetical protein GY863_21865 [bacterium]|nr:hypothetical protein [bacterium]
MKNYFLPSILSALILFACAGENNETTLISKFLLNGTETSISDSEYKIRSGNIYFESKSLEKHFNVIAKEIVPQRQLGLCRDDLCIPIEVNNDDVNSAFKENDTYYIPIVKLLENLGEDVSWNDKELSLVVEMKKNFGGFDLNK